MKQFRIKISRLEAMAKDRPEGWLEAELKRGNVVDGVLIITDNKPPPKLKGIGDVAAIISQPVARTIDKLFLTNMSGCGGCGKRQSNLNRLMPFNNNESSSIE